MSPFVTKAAWSFGLAQIFVDSAHGVTIGLEKSSLITKLLGVADQKQVSWTHRSDTEEEHFASKNNVDSDHVLGEKSSIFL